MNAHRAMIHVISSKYNKFVQIIAEVIFLLTKKNRFYFAFNYLTKTPSV
jgi:hypothetical protein